MTKYYIAIELRDNKTNELIGYGSCGTDSETREDLQNSAAIAASFIIFPVQSSTELDAANEQAQAKFNRS